MFFITAILYTVLGFWWGTEYNRKAIIVETIDELISSGFIRTRGEGDDMEILPYNDNN